MSEQAVRVYVADKIRALEVGVVHERNKLPKTSGEFKALFEYDGKVQGWVVTFSGIGSSRTDANFLKIPETYRVVTFFGFNNEYDTETEFGTSLRTVYKMLSNDRTLGGTVANVTEVSVPEISLVKVGEIFSHYAEIHIATESFES